MISHRLHVALEVWLRLGGDDLPDCMKVATGIGMPSFPNEAETYQTIKLCLTEIAASVASEDPSRTSMSSALTRIRHAAVTLKSPRSDGAN